MPKQHVLQLDWAMCSKYRDHSRFNSECHNREGLCDHLKRIGIYTLTPFNFCISNSILKLDMTIFKILRTCALDETISNAYVEL